MVKNHYNYELLEKALNSWNTRNNPTYSRALSKLKFMLLGCAWVDFEIWNPKTDKDLAMSYAWEDMSIAFMGYGQSSFTGVIIDLWMAIPKDQWDEFQNFLNGAICEAEWATPKTAPRRYISKYRQLSSRSPKDGFDLPAVTPIWGPRLREWAVLNDMDPDETEYQMKVVEEYERMGLIDLGTDLVTKQPEETPVTAPTLPVSAEPSSVEETKKSSSKDSPANSKKKGSSPPPALSAVPLSEEEEANRPPPPVTSSGKRSKAKLTLVHCSSLTDDTPTPESK